MKIYFLLVFFIFSKASHSFDCEKLFDSNVKLRICFISLNNDEERNYLTKGLNNDQVEVIELFDKGTKPEDSVAKNLEKLSTCTEGKKVCHSMVISGHQNGSFWGEFSRGELTPENLQMLSCNKKIKRIFNSVDQIFLQGCNTIDEDVLNQEKIQINNIDRINNVSSSLNNSEYRVPNHNDEANFHVTNRIARAFPNAEINGWEGIAPSTYSKSQYSLIIHVNEILKFQDWCTKNNKPADESSMKEYLKLNKDWSFRYDRDNVKDILDEYLADSPNILDKSFSKDIWEFYQNKYYGTGPNDKRRPRTIDSASSRSVPPLCENEKDPNEKLKILEEYIKTGNNSEKIDEVLNELFDSNENINLNGQHVVNIFENFEQIQMTNPEIKKRLRIVKKKLEKNKKIQEYIITETLAKKRICIQNCKGVKSCQEACGLTGDEEIELQVFKEKLTGKSNLELSETSNTQVYLSKMIDNSLDDEKSKQQEINKLRAQIKDVSEDEIKNYLIKKYGPTIWEEILWCLEETPPTEDFPHGRLVTASCKDRIKKKEDAALELSMNKNNNLLDQISALENGGPSKYNNDLQIAKTIDNLNSVGKISDGNWNNLANNFDNLPEAVQLGVVNSVNKHPNSKIPEKLRQKAREREEKLDELKNNEPIDPKPSIVKPEMVNNVEEIDSLLLEMEEVGRTHSPPLPNCDEKPSVNSLGNEKPKTCQYNYDIKDCCVPIEFDVSHLTENEKEDISSYYDLTFCRRQAIRIFCAKECDEIKFGENTRSNSICFEDKVCENELNCKKELIQSMNPMEKMYKYSSCKYDTKSVDEECFSNIQNFNGLVLNQSIESNSFLTSCQELNLIRRTHIIYREASSGRWDYDEFNDSDLRNNIIFSKTEKVRSNRLLEMPKNKTTYYVNACKVKRNAINQYCDSIKDSLQCTRSIFCSWK